MSSREDHDDQDDKKDEKKDEYPAELLSEGGEKDEEVLPKIKSLLDVVDTNYLDIGRLLWRVNEKNLYQLGNYESFDEYVENELGFKRRKAKYLVSIWKRLRAELGVKKEKIEKVGWTKAKVILPVVNEENVERWLDKAKVMSVPELAAEVAQARGKEEKEKPEEDQYKTFTVRLAMPQYENVESALSLAQMKTNSDSRAHNLDMICLEYNAGAIGGTPTDDNALKRFMDTLRSHFGVTLLAFKDPDIFKECARYAEELRGKKPKKVTIEDAPLTTSTATKLDA